MLSGLTIVALSGVLLGPLGVFSCVAQRLEGQLWVLWRVVSGQTMDILVGIDVGDVDKARDRGGRDQSACMAGEQHAKAGSCAWPTIRLFRATALRAAVMVLSK